MSNAELQQLIDERSPAEQEWIVAYLRGKVRTAPKRKQTPKQIAELASRSADLLAGRNRVTQAQAEAHWNSMDRKSE